MAVTRVPELPPKYVPYETTPTTVLSWDTSPWRKGAADKYKPKTALSVFIKDVN
jgi:hypothetical protein